MNERAMMDYRGIGHRIRLARKSKSMTQEALSRAVGISNSFFDHIERGTRKMSLETFANLCSYLMVNPNYVINGMQRHELGMQEAEMRDSLINLTNEFVDRVMGIFFLPYK